MKYNEVLAHLDALQMHKIKLGLEAMRTFLNTVGRPEEQLRFVHVAGTNGKGSVCAALAEILHRAGYRVGVYTSPHLSSVRERFRIGREYISEAEFAELGTKICAALGDEQITYFEFTTALALLWFAEQKVDLVLLETGLGGRLDATNIVTPLVAVITSVSMDHEMYLGNSLAQIAGEKAGIIKEKIPVVCGAVHPEVLPVVKAVCQQKNAPLYCLRQDFDYAISADKTWSWQGGPRLGSRQIEKLHCNRASLVQQENDSLAIAVLQLLQNQGFAVSDKLIREGLMEVSWPGRMEYFTQECGGGSPKTLRYLLDGAHNPDGVKNMAATLRQNFTYRRLIAIWGAMGDKDLASTLGVIVPLVDIFIVTKPEGERSASAELIVSYLSQEQKSRAYSEENVAKALLHAQKIATEDDLIIVGGSLYLLGAVRKLLLGELV